MKIAMTLSGIERHLEINEKLINFLKEKDIDVHIHTWNDCDLNKIIKYTNPKTYSQSDQKEAFNDNQFNNIIITNKRPNHDISTPKMSYSLKKVINQLETFEKINNFKYDIIIRSRYDLEFDDFNFLSFQDNEVICPINSKQIETCGKIFKINDAFFYGNLGCRLLHKFYDNIIQCYKITNWYHAETLFGTYALLNNINIKYQNINYKLIRGNTKSMNKNCILMVAIEDELSKHSHKTYFEHTIKSWQFYCNKYNIDFHIVRQKLPNVKYSVWHKEFVFDFVGDKYEKIGIVDFDTMIRWDAPNIFDLYDDEFVGVLDQTSISWMAHSQSAYKSVFKQFKDVKVGLNEHINGGVLFFTRQHKPFFETLKKFYLDNKQTLDNWNVPNTGKEQTLLNLHLKQSDLKRKYLPYSWNTVGMIKKGLMWHNDKLNDPTPFFFKYCYLWHFTGFPIEQRNQLINDIWNQIKQFYK